jgi:hypothetical protein
MKYNTIKKARGMTLLAMILFSLMGGVPTILGLFFLITRPGSAESVMFIPGIIFMLPVFLFYLQSYAWYTGYFTEETGLRLRGVYAKKNIPYKDIETVSLPASDEISNILNAPLALANECSRNSDLKGWYRENKKYAEIIKFCTIQIAQGSAGGHSAQTERFTGVLLPQKVELVLITLKSGGAYLLSPENPKKFIQELHIPVKRFSDSQ